MGDHVPDGDTGAHPWVKGVAPMFRAPDHDGMVALQRGSHSVGTARPLRPGGPGGEVTVRAKVKETLASPGRQDAANGVSHGDEAVEAFHLPGRAGSQATELGEHYIALDRVGAFLRRGR